MRRYVTFKNKPILITTDMNNYRDIIGNYAKTYNSKNPIVRFVARSWIAKIVKLVKNIKPDNIIDVGCGEGHISYELNKIVPVTCVDRENILCYKDLKYIKGDIYKISRAIGTYDLVTSFFVLEHLSDPLKAIENLKWLSKKGHILISVPEEPIWRAANFIRGSYIKDFGNTPGHIQHFNKPQLRRLLEKHFNKIGIERGILTLYAYCQCEVKST